MKNPVVLRTGSIEPYRRLNPVQLSMTLKLTPNSIANMTITPEEQKYVQIGTWINLYAGEENAGVFIVVNKKLNTDGMCSLTLNSASCLLTDSLIFSQWNGKQEQKTPTQALNAVLGYQSRNHFVLKTCAYNSTFSQPWTFEKVNCLAAINQILGCLEYSQIRFNYSVYPFEISIVRHSQTPTCGFEMNRGMTDISISEDRSQMYTRLYPTGAGNITIKGQYVEENTSQFGIIEQTASENSIKSESELLSWARNELHKHSKPILTIEATAIRLGELSGYSWDKPALGSVCRVRFNGTAYDERVEQINYSDLIGAPQKIKVTLGSPPVTISSIVKKSTGGGGSKKSDDKVQDMAGDWYYVNFGKEWRDGKYSFFVDAAKNQQFLANLTLTYDNFRTTITDTVNGHSSQIDQLSDSIELKVDESSVKLTNGALTIGKSDGTEIVLDVPTIVTNKVDTAYIDSVIASMDKVNTKMFGCSGTGTFVTVDATNVNPVHLTVPLTGDATFSGTTSLAKVNNFHLVDANGTNRTVTWKSQTVVTKVNFSLYQAPTTTIYYLGR